MLAAVIWLLRITNIVTFFHKLKTKYNIELNASRKFEKFNHKIIKLQCDITFLSKCSKYGLIPKFLSLKDKNNLLNRDIIHDRQLRKISRLISQHKSKVKHLRSKLAKIRETIFSKLNYLDQMIFIKLFTRENQNLLKSISETHQKKFLKLYVENKLSTPNGTVHNLSKVTLTHDQNEIFKTGLKHPSSPNGNGSEHLTCALEKVVERLKNKISKRDCNEVKLALQNYNKRMFNVTKTPQAKHNQDVVKSLKLNKDIKVVPLDKGNGIAILDADEYVNKLNAIIEDTTKFTAIPHNQNELMLDHPVIKQQNKLKYFLNKYVKPYVDSQVFTKITPSGSCSGKLYGSAKVHKNNVPLRPIVASYGTAEYNLAKYLNQYITPIIPTEYSVQNNADLLDKLASYKFSSDSKLISFDVVSLFTNVPLKEVIDLACDKVYSSNNTKPPYSKDTFKKLLQFATGGIFSFNNILYRQSDGLSMGSPLAPTLSNLFMGHLEQTFLQNDKLNLKFYVRYVDDILAIFEDDDHLSFFNYINKWHSNMKFTTEVGGKVLPFLDIDLDVSSNTLTTKVYRKPTYTGLTLNFRAICPMQWKISVLSTLINRAYIVCSSWQTFHDEIGKLTKIFQNNGYPLYFIQKVVKQYLDKRFCAPKEKDESKYLHTVKIPFFGIQSVYFKKKLQSLFRRIDKEFPIRWVFTCNKLKSGFSNKDHTPKVLRSNVIYQFACEVDPRTTYIGRTTRHLNLRIKEHREKMSAISDHRLNCSCSCKVDNFKILSQAPNTYDLNILEAMYIKKLNPTLNKQVNHDGAFFKCKLI